MATYRLFDGQSGRPGVGSSGTQPPASPAGATGGWLLSSIFSVTGQVAWLTGYWFWVASGGDTGAQKFATWNRYSTSAQNLVPGSVVTSGTLTADAMNFVPLAVPVQLAPGALYAGGTGWTAVNGIPVTSAQFGSGQPYAAGITNGILAGWSAASGSNTFPASTVNYGLGQNLFSNALGADPSAAMPNNGSGNDLLWADIQVSDTAPAGYAGSWRLRPNMADLGNYTLDTANNFTLGIEFSLSQACTIGNIWFYSPATVTQLPTAIGVFRVSDQALVASQPAPSWSGAAGSGWMSAPLSGVLPAGQYKACVCNGAASPAIWNAATADFWSTGFGSAGLTAGPLSFPSSAAATSPGQASYNGGATLTFPASNAGPYDYGVDIEVTPVTASPSPPYTASMASM